MWRLRSRLFEHIIRQEVGFFDRVRTGELMNRLSEVRPVSKMHCPSQGRFMSILGIWKTRVGCESDSCCDVSAAIDWHALLAQDTRLMKRRQADLRIYYAAIDQTCGCPRPGMNVHGKLAAACRTHD